MGSEYLEHLMAVEDTSHIPDYGKMGREEKVLAYWRLASTWNGRNNQEDMGVGDLLDCIRHLEAYSKTSSTMLLLLGKLSVNIIHMRRCKRKTNKGANNVAFLDLRRGIKHALPQPISATATR